jgi:Flp pilus assembly protein TadD
LRTPPSSAYDLAVAALERGDVEAALQRAAQATEETPEDAGAWRVQGQALLALERLEEARACLERACGLAPDRWEAQVELARACLALEDHGGAHAAWETARGLAPDEPAVRALGAALGR